MTYPNEENDFSIFSRCFYSEFAIFPIFLELICCFSLVFVTAHTVMTGVTTYLVDFFFLFLIPFQFVQLKTDFSNEAFRVLEHWLFICHSVFV